MKPLGWGADVTGLAHGETTITISAGDKTVTIPVKVYPEGVWPIMDGLLPKTANGITFTQGALPGSIHVKGTAPVWVSLVIEGTLDAGTYALSCTNGNGWEYGVHMSLASGDTAGDLGGPIGDTPTTKTIPAGAYNFYVFVAGGQTVDVDLTPKLIKIS